jgi:hypothetical protein
VSFSVVEPTFTQNYTRSWEGQEIFRELRAVQTDGAEHIRRGELEDVVISRRVLMSLDLCKVQGNGNNRSFSAAK